MAARLDSAIQQPLLPLVMLLECKQMCLVFLPYTYIMNNIINPVIVLLQEQHGPNFSVMDDNVPAHQGHIYERLLVTGVPQIKWHFL